MTLSDSALNLSPLSLTLIPSPYVFSTLHVFVVLARCLAQRRRVSR